MFGKLVLFGSGETSPTGKKIHRKILQSFSQKQNITILETPAGFQPNSHFVAEEIAKVFRQSLLEFIYDVFIIPDNPDNLSILKPLKQATYIFLGPGSPTYTVRQLQKTRTLQIMLDRWKNGATLCLSSAAAIAIGKYTLPVYEIYKTGSDLYWEKGLNIFQHVGLSFIVITHWNNKEGGEHLDTRYCYMGQERFAKLRKLLPKNTAILGIDEHTAIIFDFENRIFSIEGVGTATLLKDKKKAVFNNGNYYMFDSFITFSPHVIQSPKKPIIKKRTVEYITIKKYSLPKDLQVLLKQREKAKGEKDFTKADEIRHLFEEKGYKIEDTKKEQKVYKQTLSGQGGQT
ncbi:MAG: Type 1 glutamine amidotransferase-like domain-containing protein [Candidatus Levybacteria bacterium]|nr:Type 1 glutamine amidotransferase-like domain-containing protein [Candidatus Levybacteria bacterium]